MSVQAAIESLFEPLAEACRQRYGERLVSVVVFGSAGRGTPRADSDLDILVIADPLPDGRIARVEEFAAVESTLADRTNKLWQREIFVEFSPIFKTLAEVQRGSPLFLDMLDDARVLLDRGGVFAAAMGRLRTRLDELGAQRIWIGSAWYWDLKPDYQPGDVFEI